MAELYLMGAQVTSLSMSFLDRFFAAHQRRAQFALDTSFSEVSASRTLPPLLVFNEGFWQKNFVASAVALRAMADREKCRPESRLGVRKMGTEKCKSLASLLKGERGVLCFCLDISVSLCIERGEKPLMPHINTDRHRFIIHSMTSTCKTSKMRFDGILIMVHL